MWKKTSRPTWEDYCHYMGLFQIQQAIDQVLVDAPSPKILEAGCGSKSQYRYPSNSEIVGIDKSREQLDRNEDVTHKIVGDIQAWDMSGSNFDAIICNFVMEHLDDPDKALKNFLGALSEKGIIVIVAPNLFSFEGLITKYTPTCFHTLVMRLLFPKSAAACEHRDRFPTPFRLSMSPKQVLAFARRNNLNIRHFHQYQSWRVWKLSRENRLLAILFKIVQGAGKAVTLGRWDVLMGTYAIVMGK